MSKYIMAFDSGTTSVRTIVFDENGKIVTMAQKELKTFFPKPGYVEEDPNEIYSSQISTAVEVMSKLGIDAEDIAAIGITNQRETTIVWDKNTGEPIYNAIVWQCRRTSKFCDDLKSRRGLTKIIKDKTGLIIDAYFSGTKIHWILENIEGAKEKAIKGDLLFGTVDTYLIWKLTDGKVHVTDYSNASRTMLYNINTLSWDDEILSLFGIPKSLLPEVRSSSEVYGETSGKYLGGHIKIASAIGDQQAALFGQGCFNRTDTKNTYGTGAFILMNTGDEIVHSENGLVSTIAWGLNGKVVYALEGSIFVAGSAIKWLRDELRLIDSSEDTEYLARKVKDTCDCFVVPAFTGLGAPYWDQYARGAIVGITRGVTKAHIVRATLESIAYFSRDVIDIMQRDLGDEINFLTVDGGASKNDFLMEFQSDILGKSISRPKSIETTAAGAAYLAGLGVGFYKDLNDILKLREIDKIFEPTMCEKEREEKFKRWHKAVKRSKEWSD